MRIKAKNIGPFFLTMMELDDGPADDGLPWFTVTVWEELHQHMTSDHRSKAEADAQYEETANWLAVEVAKRAFRHD